MKIPASDNIHFFSLSCLSWMLFGLLVSFNSVVAQELTLAQLLIPQKIASGWTYMIYEDQFGFIWHSAGDLYKYDGKRSKRYRAILNDSTKISLGRLWKYGVLEEPNGNLLLASEKGLFYYNRAKDQMTPLFREEFMMEFGETPTLQSLYKDRLGRLWLGGTRQVFLIEDWQSRKIRKVRDFKYAPYVKGSTKGFLEGGNGQMYVATVEGLIKIENDFSTQLFRPEGYLEPEKEFIFSGIQKGNKDTLWLGGTDGLWVFETNKEKFTPINVNAIKGEYVRTIFLDQDERLWFTSLDKLMVRNRNGKFREIASGKTALLTGINTLLQDRYGNVWTGGRNGLAIFDVPLDDMLPFYRIEGNHPNPDNFFQKLMQDSSGGYWFRLLNSGLAYCSNLGGSLKIVLQPSSKASSEEIKNINSDPDGNVWVSTRTHGFYFSEGGQSPLMPIDLGDSIGFKGGIIITDKQDDQIAWLPSKFGLCRMDRHTLQRKWYYPNEDLPGLDINVVSVSNQSDDGTIWCSLITAEDESVFAYFDKVSGRFKLPKNARIIPKTFRIRQIQQVTKNEVWVATTSGLVVADIQDKSVSMLGIEDGLPAKIPKSIVLDRQKNIWISFGSKLCKYNDGSFECYRFHPGIGSFIYRSAILNKDGLLVFGGSKGLHVFDPEKPKRDSLTPKVYLTGFRVLNKERNLGKAPELVKDIQLQYEDKVYTFEFSAPYFVGTSKTKFKYKLEGFDEEWTESGDEQKVTYTNLAPNKYRFKVIASDWDGAWIGEEQGLAVNLHILPPWYRTWWAYLLWAALFFGSIYWLYQFQLGRQMAESEANRLKELDTIKNHLYTNITHEFRTPLTVILGMADQVKNDPKNWFSEGLSLIKRNGHQLLGLVNQMLDLSKIESGHMPLNLIQGDVISYLHYLTESFHSLADGKDVRLHFLTELSELSMDHDPEKLQQVISNLLTNAIKFTPAGGDIYLQVKQIESDLSITVKDTGPGIPQEHLPFIFDRFYQVDPASTRSSEGTGIGLSLTRELVRLMGGHISVGSIHQGQQQGSGTKFTVLLPIRETAAKSEFQPPLPNDAFAQEIKLDKKELMLKNDLRPQVLLIEDNADVVTYLTSFLSNEYEITTAHNGEEGIELALETIPDLIVSDVMMPKKDGFEVCETLKTDERTSHIPVILLTAKSDRNSKLAGLTHGADAYLAKPFHKEELLIRIEKLIEMRRKLQARFANRNTLTTLANKKASNREDQFLQNVIKIIESHLDDENFGMQQLCKKVLMSRTQLFRKLKALTGQSATRFIRSVRLEKAKVMLEQGELSVADVAYQTGFSNATYFSRIFKTEFGISPKKVKN